MLKEEEELSFSPVMMNIQFDQADLETLNAVLQQDVNMGMGEKYEDQQKSQFQSILVHQEETISMDMVVKYEEQHLQLQPVWRQGVPERRVESGLLDFQVEINAGDIHKRKYLYSNRLNRIYVDMKTNFSVQFRWNNAVSPRPMYVRATVVFSDESQAEKRVERCTQHTHDPNNKDLAQNVVKNVLHSARDKSLLGVYYCGDTEKADSWYSVLVEFPINTAGPYAHAYQFVCKNSCPNGINRRAIDIIFELEDSSGVVHGRQLVGARVCACPRRDMHRDEETEGVLKGNKRALPPAPTNNSKKIKVVQADSNIYKLPTLEIVGIRAMIAGLTSMLSIMEYDASLKRHDPQETAIYTPRIQALKAKIEYFKGLKPQ